MIFLLFQTCEEDSEYEDWNKQDICGLNFIMLIKMIIVWKENMLRWE
jgi:hypothetical protein